MKVTDGERGFLVGLPVGLLALWAFEALAPDLLQQRQWLAWGPIGLGVVFWRAVKREPVLGKALRAALWQSVIMLAVLAGIAALLVFGGTLAEAGRSWGPFLSILVASYFVGLFWDELQEIKKSLRAIEDESARSSELLERLAQRIDRSL